MFKELSTAALLSGRCHSRELCLLAAVMSWEKDPSHLLFPQLGVGAGFEQ